MRSTRRPQGRRRIIATSNQTETYLEVGSRIGRSAERRWNLIGSDVGIGIVRNQGFWIGLQKRRMQLHVSPSMRSITISSSNEFTTDLMKIKLAARHISSRTLFHTILILAFLLPFVFILTALVTLEGVNKCSSIGKLKKKTSFCLCLCIWLCFCCVRRPYWFGSGLDCVFCNDWDLIQQLDLTTSLHFFIVTSILLAVFGSY